MISWIQKTFQQHFRTVFAVLLAVTIISFIFTIGASPGIGTAERRTVARPFFGLNLSSADDSQRLFGDANLSAFLNMGYSGLEQDQLQQYALHRYASLALADQLHVPPPSEAERTEFIKTLRAFTGQNGEFDAQAYTRFRDSLKSNPRIRESDISRVLADDYRVEHIQKLLSGPGCVLPADVQRQMANADTLWTLAVATIDIESFKPSIPATDSDLGKYFEKNAFRYEIAPRFSGSYVEFPYINFIGQVNVTEQEIKAYYDANPARFPATAKTDAKDAKLDPAANYASVQPQVAAALKIERARRLAQKAAADLTVALYESKATPESVGMILATHKLTPKPLTPFSREASSAELGSSPEIAAEAFKLSAERCFSDALAAPAGAVVLLWKETIPSRKPALAEVRDKVASDFQNNEKRARFSALGATLKAAIEAKLKAGVDFDKAAEAAAVASSVKVETKTLKSFTLRQPPQDLDYAIYGTLAHLVKGGVSDMAISSSKGFFVCALEKKTPEFSETNPQYVAAKAQLARSTGNATASALLAEYVARELKKGDEPVAP